MHCTYGYLVLVLAFTLSAIDAFAGAGRVVSYVRSIERDGQFSVRSFWNRVILSKGDDHVRAINSAEYASLAFEEAEELEEFPKADAYHQHRRVAVLADDVNIRGDETAQWVNKVRHNSEDFPETTVSDRTFIGYGSSRGSQHSDDTLQDHSRAANEISSPRRLGQLLFGALQRFLVFAGFAQVMHGIIIYTGGCRSNYLNGCLAHVISEFQHHTPDSSYHWSCRRRHLLVLRSCNFCPFPWLIFRVWLGVEPRTLQPAYFRGICRVLCDILLRHHQYVDGTFRSAPG